MEIETWLSLRMKEVEDAYRIKMKGENMIWDWPDHCVDINTFIKDKLETVNSVVEKYYNEARSK